MATVQGGWAAKSSSTFARTRRLRNTTRPDASAPCAWKTRFAMSNPIVLTCPTDASSSGRSTPPWHADAVQGRPSHHGHLPARGHPIEVHVGSDALPSPAVHFKQAERGVDVGEVSAGFLDPILKVGNQPLDLIPLGAERGDGRRLCHCSCYPPASA